MSASPSSRPIRMELECPDCGTAHVCANVVPAGAPECRATQHACNHCSQVWKPAQYPTVGVSANAISFGVPLLPPSVNHYKSPDGRGGFFRSKEAAAFIDAVAIMSARKPVSGAFFHVELIFRIFQNRFLRWDLDNFGKVAFDALTIAGVISDDRYITRILVRKTAVGDHGDVGTHYLVRGKGQP